MPGFLNQKATYPCFLYFPLSFHLTTFLGYPYMDDHTLSSLSDLSSLSKPSGNLAFVTLSLGFLQFLLPAQDSRSFCGDEHGGTGLPIYSTEILQTSYHALPLSSWTLVQNCTQVCIDINISLKILIR